MFWAKRQNDGGTVKLSSMKNGVRGGGEGREEAKRSTKRETIFTAKNSSPTHDGESKVLQVKRWVSFFSRQGSGHLPQIYLQSEGPPQKAPRQFSCTKFLEVLKLRLPF